MKTPRFFHRVYAFVFAYFWLPCPICGRYFGGHEYDGGSLYTERHRGTVVCPNCKGEAVRRNNELYPYPDISDEAMEALLGPGKWISYEDLWGTPTMKWVPKEEKNDRSETD